MYIFIDEAGGFQIPSRRNAVSCVSALVVPEPLAGRLFRSFRRVILPWKRCEPEVKGSQLSEAQVAEVIGIVRRFDVLPLVVAIDMALHSEAGITRHKKDQVLKLAESVRPQMSAGMRAKVERLASRMDQLSNQLYVQSQLLTMLAQSVLQTATLYFVQRIPKTLGAFVWRPDAKDRNITEYERLWTEIVGAHLQTMSLSSPMPRLENANYEYFQRFRVEIPLPPDHLREHVRRKSQPFSSVNLDLLLRDLKFVQSHRCTGIQIVDILASAFRRACNGNLQAAGWAELGRLMPTPERDSGCVRFVSLEDVDCHGLPYCDIIRKWNHQTKRMIV